MAYFTLSQRYLPIIIPSGLSASVSETPTSYQHELSLPEMVAFFFFGGGGGGAIPSGHACRKSTAAGQKCLDVSLNDWQYLLSGAGIACW